MAPPAAEQYEYLLPNLDAAGFRRDILEAAASIGEPGEADAEHLRWMVMKVQACSIVGHALLFATAIAHAVGMSSALVTGLCAASAIVVISTGRSMAWAIVGHHTMHGGYTSLANNGTVSSKWRRGNFAIGMYHRCRDWLDWMLPEAWNLEHNKLHHYQLSEDGDPDVVERNFQVLLFNISLILSHFISHFSLISLSCSLICSLRPCATSRVRSGLSLLSWSSFGCRRGSTHTTPRTRSSSCG